MSFLDVLFKLIPFTYRNDSGTHFGWSELDAADWIITVFTLVLLVIFGWAVYTLRKSTRADKAKVERFYVALSERKGNMESGYNDFVHELSSDSELARLWNEFDESLIKTTNPLTNQIEIRDSIGAEYFFNKHNLLTDLGTKYYAAIPSILLGIGLIGTFFGLFYGLVQLKETRNNLRAQSNQLK